MNMHLLVFSLVSTQTNRLFYMIFENGEQARKAMRPNEDQVRPEWALIRCQCFSLSLSRTAAALWRPFHQAFGHYERRLRFSTEVESSLRQCRRNDVSRIRGLVNAH